MKPITQPSRTSLSRRSLVPDSRDAAPPPRVSVVIPTYKRAGLVVRAIESVLQQTFCDFELIVVDDASPDDTPQRVATIADQRVRLVRLAKNGGQARASNVGIAQARGEYVAFLDDDDEWLPNKLELQMARLGQDGDASAAYCRVYRQTPEGLQPPEPRSSFWEGDITDGLFTQDVAMTPSAYIVKRSALLEVGGFDETLVAAQDMDLWLRLSQAGYRFAIVPEPLAIYHEDGATARVTNNAVAQATGFIKIERRWGPLMQERVPDYYDRWVRNRTRKLRRAHEKLVKNMMRYGKRRDALRYVRAMAPALPWSRGYVVRALAVVLLGRLPYRLSKRARG